MSTIPFGEDKFVRLNGLQFHYIEWGNVRHSPLVLLHGFQSNAHTWDTFSSKMAARYRVLALDQRGHGDTSWAKDGDYMPDGFIRDIVGFFETLDLDPVLLVGHSMGGRHAAMVAADYPDRVRKMIIVDTPAELPPHILTMIEQQPETEDVPDPEIFDTFEEVIAKGIVQYPLTPEAELRHANYHNLHRGSDGKWRWRWDPALLLRQRLNRGRNLDLYAYLSRVQCPTLLVRGQNSPLLTPEVAQKMVATLPDGRLVDIAAAAHTVNADNAAEFNTVAAAFLQG